MEETSMRNESGSGSDQGERQYQQQQNETQQTENEEDLVENQLFSQPQLNQDQRSFNNNNTMNNNSMNHSNNMSNKIGYKQQQIINQSSTFRTNNTQNSTQDMTGNQGSFNYNSLLLNNPNHQTHDNNNNNNNENIVEQLLRTSYQDPIQTSPGSNSSNNNPEQPGSDNFSNNLINTDTIKVFDNNANLDVLSKTYNLQTYELQPEIKGMIVALKFIAVPNHKIVEEIGKLGFAVTESNVFMVWEQWQKDKESQGKGQLCQSYDSLLKQGKDKDSDKKKNKMQKYSGRYSTDEDEDDYDEDEDDDEVANDVYLRKNMDDSDEFDENCTDQGSSQKYIQKKSQINTRSSNRKNYQNSNSNKRDFSMMNGNNNNNGDSGDFDSDYDESYKNKALSQLNNKQQKYQKRQELNQYPRKQLKLHGDHYLFYNQEVGQCIYCAQKNKENDVYTTCMECEGSDPNKFYICEECFDINHATNDINPINYNKSHVKNEEIEQPYMDTDEDNKSDQSDGIKLKKIKPYNEQGYNNNQDKEQNNNQGQDIEVKENYDDNQQFNEENQQNSDVNQNRQSNYNQTNDQQKRYAKQAQNDDDNFDSPHKDHGMSAISKQNQNNNHNNNNNNNSPGFETNNQDKDQNDNQTQIDNNQQNKQKKVLRIFRNPQQIQNQQNY